jgi:hypothetical protein
MIISFLKLVLLTCFLYEFSITIGNFKTDNHSKIILGEYQIIICLFIAVFWLTKDRFSSYV